MEWSVSHYTPCEMCIRDRWVSCVWTFGWVIKVAHAVVLLFLSEKRYLPVIHVKSKYRNRLDYNLILIYFHFSVILIPISIILHRVFLVLSSAYLFHPGMFFYSYSVSLLYSTILCTYALLKFYSSLILLMWINHFSLSFYHEYYRLCLFCSTEHVIYFLIMTFYCLFYSKISLQMLLFVF